MACIKALLLSCAALAIAACQPVATAEPTVPADVVPVVAKPVLPKAAPAPHATAGSAEQPGEAPIAALLGQIKSSLRDLDERVRIQNRKDQ